MSQRVCRSLEDVCRHPGWVIAECRRCGNKVRLIPHHLSYYFRSRELPTHWPDFAYYLRCRCGARQPKVGFHPRELDGAERLPMVQVPAPAPKGVSQKTWNRRPSR
jgi:hypothetical protein